MPDDTHHNEDLDQLLDSALSTYAEPRAGLEARVLAHLSTQPTRRHWLPWAIALPIAACLALLLAPYPRHDHTEPVHQAQHNSAPETQPTPQRSIAQAAPVPTRQPKPRIVAAHTTQHLASAQAPPKLDLFPTPQPLSSEEQALLHFVAHTPASEIKSLQEAQQKQDEPLYIAEIVIQPIQSPDTPETKPNQ
jgi:hypothetical protein